MVVGIPFLKLGSLLVKQITKPLTSRLRVEASRRPQFAKICTATGQHFNYVMSRVTVFANGYKFIGVKPLTEEEALKTGVELISETIVFLIAAGIVVFEYDRSERKNALKAEKAAIKERIEKEILESRLSKIESEIIQLKEELNLLSNINKVNK